MIELSVTPGAHEPDAELPLSVASPELQAASISTAATAATPSLVRFTRQSRLSIAPRFPEPATIPLF
ncbi:hypothetical protein; Putative glycine-rich protein (partial) [Frankia alni ACN14a]|uniref:Uncharacterized protein n=1 Tax=Frankia alni (strain DSM 45986 / CECT 9034 / ACN14a) TaxID=326424 RepID=Q0RJ39_FRAAA|nr:hypothetical protein; Putative glycine-rich protein (partial) [Frankia alni ACN14a]